MELLLATHCYVIDGHPYFRIHLSRKNSDMLELKKGDKLLVDIKEIQRTNLNPTYRTIKLDELETIKLDELQEVKE